MSRFSINNNNTQITGRVVEGHSNSGDSNQRIKIGALADTVAFDKEGGLKGFRKLFKGLFYFSGREATINGKTEVIYINRRSAQKWLAKKGVRATVRIAKTFFQYVEKGHERHERSEILSKIKPYTDLKKEDLKNILDFIQAKRKEIDWSFAIEPVKLFRPSETGLTRSVLFFKDGRVIIQFNRTRQKDKVLGQGAFSKIKTGFDITSKKMVAISTTRSMAGDRGYLKDPMVMAKKGYENAAAIHQKKGVISLLGQYDKESKKRYDKFIVLMDLIEGEDLYTNMTQRYVFLSTRRQQACELLEGLKGIHESNRIHLDLKEDNVMVAKDGHLHIIDLGLCTKVEGRTPHDNNFGNEQFASPQQLRVLNNGDPINQKHDIWAAGGILWNLLSRDVQTYFKWSTFDASQTDEQYGETQASWSRNEINWMLRKGLAMEELGQKSGSSAQIAYLIATMLHLDMEERPTAAEAHASLQRILGQ